MMNTKLMFIPPGIGATAASSFHDLVDGCPKYQESSLLGQGQ
jgi:hypothetical protein